MRERTLLKWIRKNWCAWRSKRGRAVIPPIRISASARRCSLRAAFEGEKRFSEIAVVGWHRDAKPEERGYAFPCGICRQFLREFAVPGMKVYVAVSEKEADIREYTLEQLLPESFGPEDLL